MSIYDEIAEERKRQDALFGGQLHDDQHTVLHWVAIAVRHLGMAVDDGSPEAVSGQRYRRQMLRVAATCVAAVESFDRRLANRDPMDEMRRLAKRVAELNGEPQLLVLEPPLTEINREQRMPYVVALADASAEELASKCERYNP